MTIKVTVSWNEPTGENLTDGVLLVDIEKTLYPGFLCVDQREQLGNYIYIPFKSINWFTINIWQPKEKDAHE